MTVVLLGLIKKWIFMKLCELASISAQYNCKLDYVTNAF